MADYRDIPCPNCGKSLKLLLTTFYCENCDIKGASQGTSTSFTKGYVVVDKQWLALTPSLEIPKGTPIHVYKTYSEAQMVLPHVGVPAKVAEIDLSPEQKVQWSTPYSHEVFTNTKPLKIKPV